MDFYYHDNPYCLSVMTIRDFPSKSLQINIVEVRMTDPMTVRPTHDRFSPGPSCFTATTKMSLHLCSYVYFVSFLFVLFASYRTINDSLQVLSLMVPKQDQVYAHGHSKCFAPSTRLVIGFDDEHYPEYVPPSIATPV